MANYNRVYLIGTLAQAPQSRATTGGLGICTFPLVAKRSFLNTQGEEREESCQVDVELFGKHAEAGARLQAGMLILIEGALRMEQWDDKATGRKRSRLLVRADRVQPLTLGADVKPPSFNRIFLLGNVTRDPEKRFTAGGRAICKFGLAVNRRYTTAQGEDREETCFVDLEAFGKQAEVAGQYLRKGGPVLIEGYLRLDQWDDRTTGEHRSKLLANVDRLQLLGSANRGGDEFGGGGNGSGGGDHGSGDPAEAASPAMAESAPRRRDDPPPAAASQAPGPASAPVDDIPF
jgi:single-strand DNA-binding protein